MIQSGIPVRMTDTGQKGGANFLRSNSGKPRFVSFSVTTLLFEEPRGDTGATAVEFVQIKPPIRLSFVKHLPAAVINRHTCANSSISFELMQARLMRGRFRMLVFTGLGQHKDLGGCKIGHLIKGMWILGQFLGIFRLSPSGEGDAFFF